MLVQAGGLDRPRELAGAAADGRCPGDLDVFLQARAAQPRLCSTLLALLDKVADRVGWLADLGQVRLVELVDAALTRLISHNGKLRGFVHWSRSRISLCPSARSRRSVGHWPRSLTLSPASASH
ncbi:hypothetical protein ACFWDZ_21140 [Micromonospora aurantiaca]|uniref:hypothetical protein n=1 Tax=Micromonospora aurantiaca (nom. illeg.) TaxID=47850 RepID=UPI0036502F0C